MTLLSYGDVVLRESDGHLLTGPYWLNDQVIAFFFEYLQREGLASGSHRVGCVAGALTYLLAFSKPGEAAEICQPLRLGARDLVLFVVNNNPDAQQAEGGSHWSLLAFHRPTGTFRHYDSCRGTNAQHARRLAAAVADAVDAGTPAFVEVGPSPQQSNGHDCGLFVLAVAEQLAAWSAESPDFGSGGSSADAAAALARFEAETLPQAVNAAAVRGLRARMLQLIQSKVAAAGRGG